MFVLKTTELLFCGVNFALSLLCCKFPAQLPGGKFPWTHASSVPSTEVGLGACLGKSLDPIFRWLAFSPSPDTLGCVTWRWFFKFSMPGLLVYLQNLPY